MEAETARSRDHTAGTDRRPQPGDVCRVTHLVSDYGHPRVVEVQPGWNLPVGDYEDIPNPRRMPLDRPQRVPQLFVIFEAAGGHIFILLGLGGREISMLNPSSSSSSLPSARSALRGNIFIST